MPGKDTPKSEVVNGANKLDDSVVKKAVEPAIMDTSDAIKKAGTLDGEKPEAKSADEPEKPEANTVEKPEAKIADEPEKPEAKTADEPEKPKAKTADEPEKPEAKTADEPEKPDAAAKVMTNTEDASEAEKEDKTKVKVETDCAKKGVEEMETEKTEPEAKVMSNTEDAKDGKEAKTKVTVVTDCAEKGVEEMETDKTEQNKCEELEKLIVKQIEFYFGDFNLGRDRFLQGQIKNDSGWVTFEVLMTFNRLKNLTMDADYIVECVARAPSKLVVVSEDKQKLRRNPDKPLPTQDKEWREGVKGRSIYAKGFPTDLTLEKVQQFFEPHGPLEHVQMRWDTDRSFKGSVFAIFAETADADKFLKAESIKYDDVDLERLLKQDYFKKKFEEKKVKKESDLKDSEDEKKVREDEEKESFRQRITKGSVLQLQDLPTEITVDELRETFGDFGEVAWVEYEKGDATGRVRFAGEGEATVALKKAKKEDGTILVKERSVKGHVLEGDDEIDFWKSLFQSQRQRKERAKHGKRGRGGRGFGRGGPPFKKRRIV